MRKYFELNEKHQNLWDTVKAKLRRKFRDSNAHIRRERSQISN